MRCVIDTISYHVIFYSVPTPYILTYIGNYLTYYVGNEMKSSSPVLSGPVRSGVGQLQGKAGRNTSNIWHLAFGNWHYIGLGYFTVVYSSFVSLD